MSGKNNKSMLSSFALLAGVLVLMVVCGAIYGDDTDHLPTGKRVGSSVNQAIDPHDNVNPSLVKYTTDAMEYHEGSNLIFTANDGTRILANVKNGKVISSTVKNSLGKTLPSRFRVNDLVGPSGLRGSQESFRDNRRLEEVRQYGEERQRQREEWEEAVRRATENADIKNCYQATVQVVDEGDGYQTWDIVFSEVKCGGSKKV